MTENIIADGVFFAFPSKPDGMVDIIRQGARLYAQRYGFFQVFPWTELDVSGRLIWERVLSSIDERPILVADVSTLNANVTYEIGYAIGKRKKLRFVVNSQFIQNDERDRIGIFDVIGYQKYDDAESLAAFLHTSLKTAAEMYVDEEKDSKAPIFLFDAYEKSELVNHIKTCV
ncbi:MAG: hypothetical protein V2I43_01255, partial [Parvularcula sp.]|nr:hypothetical protein [Parvularcula sp.]